MSVEWTTKIPKSDDMMAEDFNKAFASIQNTFNSIDKALKDVNEKIDNIDIPEQSSTAEKAEKDIKGNVIHTTYALKSDVGKVDEALDVIIDSLNQIIEFQDKFINEGA